VNLHRFIEAMAAERLTTDRTTIVLQRYAAIYAAGFAKGRAEGRETLRTVLLRIARRRGVEPSPGQLQAIRACESTDRLMDWIERLAMGASLGELLPQ
jgi:hypothetical protein